MLRIARVATCAVASLMLSGCADLFLIHDPETGFITKDQIEPFLKATRCEMKTFYAANDKRQTEFENELKEQSTYVTRGTAEKSAGKLSEAAADFARAEQIRIHAVETYPHFTLSPYLFGGVYMDLKVIDTLGLPTAGASASTFDNKTTINSTHSRTWLFGPTLNSQDTYEQIDGFIIEQTSSLYAGADPFACYSTLPKDLDGLAAGAYPELTKFTRIRVNGDRPLAAWLQDRSTQLWHTLRAEDEKAEGDQMIPAQSTYNFTVQITGGLDVKYSLVSLVWSPAQIDVGAQIIHSNELTLAVNGVDASLAAGAKVGTAVDATCQTGQPSPPLQQTPVPYVCPNGFHTLFKTQKATPAVQPRGFLLYPPTLPTPGQ